MPELPAERHHDLAEIWGDTVDLKHLGWSIVIGGTVSLTGYFLASRGLQAVVATPALARAYAMLAGLAGCVLSGVICARLFAPKRTVIEGTIADPAARLEVLHRLAEQVGDLGSVHDLPPAVVKEMKELEIYELFANYRPPMEAAEPNDVRPAAFLRTAGRA